MACSEKKLPHEAAAMDLYQGSMYSTFRANVRPNARPHVVILSAKHGFISEDTVIAPYEQRLTRSQADALVADLDSYLQNLPAFAGVKKVLLAGGAEYRNVMRAAVTRLIALGRLTADVQISETTGGIGHQRQQLGTFLRRLAPVMADVVGHHPNGTPLYRTMGTFTVGQEVDVVYASRPDLAPAPAVIVELFNGPSGPTATVRTSGTTSNEQSFTWVSLTELQPRRPGLLLAA